jgi:hypothetical protein
MVLDSTVATHMKGVDLENNGKAQDFKWTGRGVTSHQRLRWESVCGPGPTVSITLEHSAHSVTFHILYRHHKHPTHMITDARAAVPTSTANVALCRMLFMEA